MATMATRLFCIALALLSSPLLTETKDGPERTAGSGANSGPGNDDDDFSAAEVTSSPHDSRSVEAPLPDERCGSLTEKPSCLRGTLPCVDDLESLLDAEHVVTKSYESIAQRDTLHGITTTKILGAKDVPIYHFQQSGRISPQRLPFSLVLVSRLDRLPHREISVEDKTRREDSWFLGHYWSPIVVCACEITCAERNGTVPESDRFLHVGWKFTSLGFDRNDAPFFYALIIQPKRDEGTNAEKLKLAGFKTPGWMVVSLNNGTYRVM